VSGDLTCGHYMEEMDLSTHTSGEKSTAFELEKSSSLYFEFILTIFYYFTLLFHIISHHRNFKSLLWLINKFGRVYIYFIISHYC